VQQQVVTPDVREPTLPRGRDTFEVLAKPVHTTPRRADHVRHWGAL
jgi:hypothetical protein